MTSLAAKLLRYETRCYFNVQSKAGMSQLNLSTEPLTNKKMEKKNKKTKK